MGGVNEMYDAWINRDLDKYCKYHPNIHPSNEKKITLKLGEIKVNGQIKNFKFCPKCLRAQQNEKTRRVNYL